MGRSTPGPAVSVVIPARDAELDLERCLTALEGQSLSREAFEVVVVDDGSRDATAAVAERRGARVIRQDGLGAAAARNRGARESRGEIVILLDADCVPDDRWAEELARPFADDSTAGAVGPIDSAQRSLVARYVQLEVESRYARLEDGGPTDFINTANCAFRRDILSSYPFDEAFGRLEDIELSFRLTGGGHRMVFVRGARVSHRHPERIWSLMRRQFGYARYAAALYRRHPGKVVSDASTPHGRRARLVSLALALALVPVAFLVPAAWLACACLAVLSVAFSFPVFVRAFRVDPRLGLLAPWIVLTSNLAFVAGVVRGLLPGKARLVR